MAKDSAEASDSVRVDKQAAETDATPDHLTRLDDEIAEAEQRVDDATAHLEELKTQKRERS
jgi:septal ring factor EnvC (AmiA/AmiB activator)